MKPTGLDGNAQFIVSKRTYQKENASYGLFFGTGNKLNIDINLNAGSGDRFESRTVFQNDQWYQVMLVFDGTAHVSQRARLYVNGTLDRDAALSSSSLPNHPSPLFIGVGQTGYAYKFKGLIDELSISREIPAAESLAAAHQGFWTLEKWLDMPYKEIGPLVGDPRFYQPPAWKEPVRASGKNLDWYQSGGRFRGQIQVSATGNYGFSPRKKRPLSLLLPLNYNPDLKTGKIASTSPNIMWEKFIGRKDLVKADFWIAVNSGNSSDRATLVECQPDKLLRRRSQ